jgi:hypothetical protein
MSNIIKLTQEYNYLWTEYEKFLELNELTDLDILQVWFIYLDSSFNSNCFEYDPYITKEETCMYDLSVDNDFEPMLVANNVGVIYAQTLNREIYGFRCSSSSLRSCQKLKLKQKPIYKKSLMKEHYLLLKNKYYFPDKKS